MVNRDWEIGLGFGILFCGLATEYTTMFSLRFVEDCFIYMWIQNGSAEQASNFPELLLQIAWSIWVEWKKQRNEVIFIRWLNIISGSDLFNTLQNQLCVKHWKDLLKDWQTNTSILLI